MSKPISREELTEFLTQELYNGCVIEEACETWVDESYGEYRTVKEVDNKWAAEKIIEILWPEIQGSVRP